jgi:hypothetical protein
MPCFLKKKCHGRCVWADTIWCVVLCNSVLDTKLEPSTILLGATFYLAFLYLQFVSLLEIIENNNNKFRRCQLSLQTSTDMS